MGVFSYALVELVELTGDYTRFRRSWS